MKDLVSRTEKMFTYLLQSDNDFLLYEKDHQANFDIFSDICNNLLNCINQKKTIPERNLWDFNKMTIGLVRDNLKQLPGSYIELVDRLSDYWRNELESETNSERKYSYIRLYQASSLLKVYYEDQKKEEEIDSFLNKYEIAYRLLDKIRHNPGITFNMLQDLLHISACNLSSASFKNKIDEMIVQLDSLEKDGFLLKRGSEEYPYYILTNTGDVLYKKLYNRKKSDICINRWNRERLAVFFYLLIQLADKRGINGYLIWKVLQITSEYDDDQIAQSFIKITTEQQNSPGKNVFSALYNTDNKGVAVLQSYLKPRLSVDEMTKKEYYGKKINYKLSYCINDDMFGKKAEIPELERVELKIIQNMWRDNSYVES